MKHVYLVALELDDRIAPGVVDNYVFRAIKNFHKHDDQKAFDGISEKPRGVNMRLPYYNLDKSSQIRESVELIQALDRYFDTLERLKGK